MNTTQQESSENNRIYLKDYKASSYIITKIDLTFELALEKTIVNSTLFLDRNLKDNILNDADIEKLFLNGKNLTLLKVVLDGVAQEENQDFIIKKNGILFLNHINLPCNLEIQNSINPKSNTELQGLYVSGIDLLCTQNEPEGFSNITYFLDRPDIMTVFKTKIIADKNDFPVLLSNGNQVDRGDLADGKHFVVWQDPSLKPCYLFALVAGKLGVIEDNFVRSNGKDTSLRIYCDIGNEEKCWFAMEALKNAMKWDEQRFSLTYDLDIYMIVAVDSFNFGAMENKGLNIFNSVYVLASKDVATDSNFYGIEGVIGHEYFHNWTGNRVTCRDWFQLTLKEGLTVFRDQEFSSDLNSRVLQRINDVDRLREAQFVEDASPLSHPIKPKSYIEINNFYTSTIYEKGAEVIRMLHTFLGEKNFQSGMSLYFKRHDGNAVTTQDFVNAMFDANLNQQKIDRDLFSKWYHQKGTPILSIEKKYDKNTKELRLKITQSLPMYEEENKEWDAFFMPVRIGLVSEKRALEGRVEVNYEECLENLTYFLRDDIFIVKDKYQEIIFRDVEEGTALSLNRNFSAPIIINYNYTDQELKTLISFDSDLFNRIDSLKQLYKKIICDFVNNKQDQATKRYKLLIPAIHLLLEDQKIEPAFKAACLELPSVSIISLEYTTIDHKKIFSSIEKLKSMMANDSIEFLFSELSNFKVKQYVYNCEESGMRAYKNALISLLCASEIINNRQQKQDSRADQFLSDTSLQVNNMNDRFALLVSVARYKSEFRDELFKNFYQDFKNDALTVTKYFSLMALGIDKDFSSLCKFIENETTYNFLIPNHVRALYGTFIQNNPLLFHREDGFYYRFIAQKIYDIDKNNGKLAARLAGTAFKDFHKLEKKLHLLMKEQLEVLSKKKITKDTFEIINSILSGK